MCNFILADFGNFCLILGQNITRNVPWQIPIPPSPIIPLDELEWDKHSKLIMVKSKLKNSTMFTLCHLYRPMMFTMEHHWKQYDIYMDTVCQKVIEINDFVHFLIKAFWIPTPQKSVKLQNYYSVIMNADAFFVCWYKEVWASLCSANPHTGV